MGERAALLRLTSRPPTAVGVRTTTFLKRVSQLVQGHGAEKTSSVRNCLRRQRWRLVVRGTGVERGSAICPNADRRRLALKVVTVFTPVIPLAGCCWRPCPRGRLAGAGRWSKACQLARNDDARNQKPLVVLNATPKPGLFLAGGRTASPLPAGICWRPRDSPNTGFPPSSRDAESGAEKLVFNLQVGGQSCRERQANGLFAPASCCSGLPLEFCGLFL